MLIYHLVIECCLELMLLRSSILFLIINMDGLQIWATIYALLISCPLYSFVILCLDEHRNMESLFWRVSLFVPWDSHPITFNVRRYSRQMMVTFSLCIGRTCESSLCFPRIDFASLFRKKPIIFFFFFFTLHCIWSLKFSKKKAPAHSHLGCVWIGSKPFSEMVFGKTCVFGSYEK